MVILDLEWTKHKEWLIWNEKTQTHELRPDAPIELWDSYHRYMKDIEYYLELEKKTGIRYI